jgi:transposase-like protein
MRKEEQVRKMTARGMRQGDIAAKLGVSRDTVYRAQKKLGLRAWQEVSPEEERTIVDLLEAGYGIRKIGRELAVAESRVCQIAKKFKIRHMYNPHGRVRFNATAKQVERITDLALTHLLSATEIAKTVGVPYRTARRICHQATACEQFLGGGTRVGLESYLPTKWRSNLRAPREEESMIPMEMSPSYFVWKFFRFALLPGTTLSQKEIQTCADILLAARCKFFGPPADEQAYLSELRDLVVLQLIAASPSTPPAVN